MNSVQKNSVTNQFSKFKLIEMKLKNFPPLNDYKNLYSQFVFTSLNISLFSNFSFHSRRVENY